MRACRLSCSRHADPLLNGTCQIIDFPSAHQSTGPPAQSGTFSLDVRVLRLTYKLGNRSGIEWILDQYREKTPKDPTIRERFNTYRFAEHKEKVIDLIARVTRVSVETMDIVEAMKLAPRRSADNQTTDAAE
ncbi:type ISP restriction/modification enzyme [Mycoplana dimorpha]|uniref:type ISP restriction/modification enzyme n=1 Tax=Mycoplana dimorpha TaxID=28320 RepID=UPI001FDED005|nr:type ISP restriction/modification enzyme [Mycoplana dimorpha]